MFVTFLISLATSLQLWAVGAAPPAAPAVRVAQAAPRAPAASPADRAAGQVRTLEAERRSVAGQKAALMKSHEAQLAEVDRLKQRRASWRRDRQLKRALADSQQTAAVLSRLDARIRGIDRDLERANKALLAATRRALRGHPSASRRAQLIGWLGSARSALVRTRKIILPAETFDPLADPEDLEYHAQLIAQTEKELEAEIGALAARESRYDRMVALRDKASRAEELSGFDDDRPRRTTGRIGSGDRNNGTGAGGGLTNGDSAQPLPPADSGPNPDPGGGSFSSDGDPTVVLADVVDAGTLDALRRAESSGDPKARATATKRTRQEVQARLARLKRARALIEARARKLRKQ